MFTLGICFGFVHGMISRQVYQLSIGAACGLSWPSDRIVVQVLHDSTDITIKVGSNYHFVVVANRVGIVGISSFHMKIYAFCNSQVVY